MFRLRLDGERGRSWRALGSRFELMDNEEPSYVLDLKHVLGPQKHQVEPLAKVSLLSSEALSGFIPLLLGG